MSEVAMELMNVKKKIGKREIIKGLSFTINKGEVFGFIGPNGAGKTTTIRMMVGLIQLTDGDVRILGNSIKSDFKEAVREVGAIVENPEMYPFMTGWKNLMHYARMIPGVTTERVQEVIKLVGLEKPIKTKVNKYSLGMRQRLGIAQALLHSPSVLILDEPTNGLDPTGIREIRRYIRRLAVEDNVSVIVSSHLLSEIELMCDRIGIIQNGELIAIKDLHEKAETNEYIVSLDVYPVEESINILRKMEGMEILSTDKRIQIKTIKDNIPFLVTTLVQNDIEIYGVNVLQSTLEDQFIEMIGENIIE